MSGWLILTCIIAAVHGHGAWQPFKERQRYDGWYNNFANPQWGGMEDTVIYKTTSAYSDLTYAPAGPDRPNPRYISNQIFQGPSGIPDYRNRTALFAFFGQAVAYDVAHVSDNACPMELIKIPVPPDDPDFKTNDTDINFIPFVRTGYDKKTGLSPANPRRPLNSATAWLDGNCIYGLGEVWANSLRDRGHGGLVTGNATGYPALNGKRLPMENFPSPVTLQRAAMEKLWMFGDEHTHQNPGLMAIALVWFRYHNHMAATIRERTPHLSDEEIHQAARRRVIATLQNIALYEWLPAMLGEENPLPPYTGYDNYVQPSISAEFEAVALRIGDSLMPSGIYVRDDKCAFKKHGEHKAIRLCNSYWRSQELIHQYGVENVLLGLASQLAEREDNIVVSDLRGKSFGPQHFTRIDLVTQHIMRGRDHGLPDYNTVRAALGLEPAARWEDINPELARRDPELFEKLRVTYNHDLSKLDLYPGALLESTEDGPGEVVKRLMKDQFLRLRDGDRFWFENEMSGQLTKEEIDEIKKLRFKDVIVAATGIKEGQIQDDVFYHRAGDPCPQPEPLREEDLEECTPHHGYDYFEGSEISYIVAWTILGLVPFICIAVAYCIAQIRQFSTKKPESKDDIKDLCKLRKPSDDILPAMEWRSPTESLRQVDLRFEALGCTLSLLSNKRAVRSIDLSRQDSVAMWIATDKQRDLLLIHVPKEYDLVLRVCNEDDRDELVNTLREKLKAFEKPLHVHQCNSSYIYKKAITKTKRQELITKFFRGVFAEAYHIDEIKPTDELQINQCKEIVQCELSRAEFAEALALKTDSLFVNQMFSIIDRDRNGYISFRELLYAVLLFSKGSCEDKLQLLFHMYDQDKSGTLDRKEVTVMLRSMMEMANTDVDSGEIERLVDQMFVTAGVERRNSLVFEDFQHVLADQLDMLWDVCLDWKGTKVCLPKKKNKRQSTADLKRRPSFRDAVEPNKAPTKLHIMLTKIRHYIENHRQQIVYLLLFFSATIAQFCERFYFYANEQEHVGTRSIAGYGVALTRGAAGVMCLTFSLLLVTMCRNTITKLRDTFLNRYVPFDSHVSFHKVVAYTALLFTVAHVVGYCFNFYHIGTQPTEFLCVFKEVHFRNDFLPKFHWWTLNTLVGFTGILLVITISVIYIFATQTARSMIFNAFWSTHRLFYILYVLILLHGCTRLVQDPAFPWYFIGPAILFTLDKMVSLSRQKRGVTVTEADLLPSDVTHLAFKRPSNFEYKSGQWIRLSCKTLGRDEYHAFTLTSAPHEDTLAVHIRGVGPWTHNIRTAFNPDTLKEKPYPKLYVDGPFGAGQQDWYRYDVSVLVGGGIGVTPYASILKDFAHMSSIRNQFKIKCHKVYFIWVTTNQKHFEWFIDILKQVEEQDRKDMVETHIFITQLFQNFDLRTTMLYICEEHFQKMSSKSMFTGLRSKTHFGRPNFDKILDAVRQKHPKVRKVGVFSCGPPGVTKGVQKACHEVSKVSDTRFEHHFENF